MQHSIQRISIVDSHTGGEPTRVVSSGGPDLGAGRWRRARRFSVRNTTVSSARSSMNRAVPTCSSARCSCDRPTLVVSAGVIFFNNVGLLGMCGHGTIGVVATLAHLGRIAPGAHRIETPVGVVTATLHDGRHRFGRKRAELSRGAAPSRSRCRASGTSPAMSRGAATGSSLSSEHGEALDARERPAARRAFAWRCGRRLTRRGFPRWITSSLFGPPRCAGRFAQLRPLPRQGLRPLAVRHRHERASSPASPPTATFAEGADVGAGEHPRQHASPARYSLARSKRAGVIVPTITGTAHRHRRSHAAARRARSRSAGAFVR